MVPLHERDDARKVPAVTGDAATVNVPGHHPDVGGPSLQRDVHEASSVPPRNKAGPPWLNAALPPTFKAAHGCQVGKRCSRRSIRPMEPVDKRRAMIIGDGCGRYHKRSSSWRCCSPLSCSTLRSASTTLAM